MEARPRYGYAAKRYRWGWRVPLTWGQFACPNAKRPGIDAPFGTQDEVATAGAQAFNRIATLE